MLLKDDAVATSGVEEVDAQETPRARKTVRKKPVRVVSKEAEAAGDSEGVEADLLLVTIVEDADVVVVPIQLHDLQSQKKRPQLVLRKTRERHEKVVEMEKDADEDVDVEVVVAADEVDLPVVFTVEAVGVEDPEPTVPVIRKSTLVKRIKRMPLSRILAVLEDFAPNILFHQI